jgi:hypothetical protein
LSSNCHCTTLSASLGGHEGSCFVQLDVPSRRLRRRRSIPEQRRCARWTLPTLGTFGPLSQHAPAHAVPQFSRARGPDRHHDTAAIVWRPGRRMPGGTIRRPNSRSRLGSTDLHPPQVLFGLSLKLLNKEAELSAWTLHGVDRSPCTCSFGPEFRKRNGNFLKQSGTSMASKCSPDALE